MEPKSVVMRLENLSCPDCAMKIAMVLKRSKGVADAEVIYTTSKVRVIFDPAVAKVEDLVALIEKLGYDVKEIKQ